MSTDSGPVKLLPLGSFTNRLVDAIYDDIRDMEQLKTMSSPTPEYLSALDRYVAAKAALPVAQRELNDAREELKHEQLKQPVDERRVREIVREELATYNIPVPILTPAIPPMYSGSAA